MIQQTQGQLYNPATGEIIANIKENSRADFKAALADAREAQPAWAALAFKVRAKYIRQLGRAVHLRMDEVAQTIATCTGKTRIDALSTEVIPAIIASNYYARSAARFLKKQKVKGSSFFFLNKQTYVQHEPYGVIGIISPWNYPFAIPFHEVVMALMAGNGVILKVATQAQPVGDLLKELVMAAGLPAGLFQLVYLSGVEAGKFFIEEGVDKIFFTGSTAVGKELMTKAADKLVPLCLELGGKDAMIVLKDANLSRAVQGAIWAGLSNAGQSCGGVERIYIEAAIYDDFLGLLKKEMSKLKLGVDRNFDVEIGALATEQQLSKLREQVKDAVRKGAGIYSPASAKFDGNPDLQRGFFHPLVVLENVTDEMAVRQEEVFGPVLIVEKVQDINEAIMKANELRYGLTASLWTNDQRLARWAAGRLEAGAVTINDHLMSHGMPQTPWGGLKLSGIGRTHGQSGFEELTRLKVVVKERFPFLKRNLWWYPHSELIYTGLKAAADLFYRGKRGHVLHKLANVWKLILSRFS